MRAGVAGEQLGFTRQRNFLRPADLFPGWFEREDTERTRQQLEKERIVGFVKVLGGL